jgi:YhcH/YjgK/YiaL family protein
MIIDQLPNLPLYLPPDLWKSVESFIARLDPDLPKGEHVIQKPDIFARISSYKTVPVHEGRIEAHKQFIDIQILLAGTERIDVVPLDTLLPDTDYDSQNDVQFYKTVDTPAVRLTLVPGSFALFFPQDAHCPGLTPQTENQHVEKVVIKINTRHFRTAY